MVEDGVGGRRVVSSVVIELMDDGKVEVSGPLDNRVLLYGLLGMAREIVQQRAMGRSGANLMVVPPINGLKKVSN